MTEVNIKEEKADSDDNDDCIPELTKLLEEVQREEESQPDKAECPAEITKLLLEFKREDEAHSRPADDEDSDPGLATLLEEVKRENEPPPVVSSKEEQISKNFVESNDECVQNLESVEDADIEILQELLRQKQRELKEAESRILSSSDTESRKRKTKNCEENAKDGKKRKKNESNELRRSRSRSVPEADTENNPVGTQTQPSSSNTEIIADMETDIEKLLKAEDDNSDEEGQNTPHEEVLSNVQSNFVLPTGMPTDVETFGQNQMTDYQPIFASGAPFFMPNMGMPMMGYGHPHMNIQSDPHEVECLPVINSSGFLGMPTFKRIKLEKVSQLCNKEGEIKESPEEKRKRVLEACSSLLEQLEFPEPTGKFIYTPTVTKVVAESTSNSVLQKIVNLNYEFQSIGPKLNLADWGLREIASCNADVAKKIGLSAEMYFEKITEKANTTARKLIKVEDAAADENRETQEIEEPTLSTFLKNSMTQTEPLSCRECVLRKRIVGHHIGIQATVGSGSVGSQTVSFYENSDRQSLTAGLNHKQLSALFKFSNLIREPSKSTTIEMFKLRETLLDIYNSSQAPNFEQVHSTRPAMDPVSHSYAHSTHIPVRDTRIDNGLNDPRLYSHSLIQNTGGVATMNHNLGVDPHMMNQRHMPHHMQTPRYNPAPANFAIHPIQAPNVRPRFVNHRHQPPDMQEPRKSYGRGGQMHY